MQSLNAESQARLEQYLAELRCELQSVPSDVRESLLARVRAEIEIDIAISPGAVDDSALEGALARLGEPALCARRLLAQLGPLEPVPQEMESAAALRPCRACRNEVALDARFCPRCGAPFPARTAANVAGYEWKSRARLFGWPLVHVAFGRDSNGRIRVAKGVVAIGQFGIGAITIAQFGVGLLFGLGQFMAAPLAIGQFAAGLVAIGQIALGVLYGLGQIATGLAGASMLHWPGRR